MEFVTGTHPGSVFQVVSIFLIVSCSLALFCSASSSITQGQTLKDGQTLISDNQTFELGFFSPANSSSWYVGIWYFNLSNQTIVWVANREKPISNKAGVLTIGSDGNLVILDGNSSEMWSSNVSSISKNTSAVLTDTGNLVLSTNETTERPEPYWESFNFPTDTFLPGMRVKVNAEEGVNRAFRSWKSANDPAPGDYFWGVDPRVAPQLMIWNGSERRWRSGHWNKQIFTDLPEMLTRYSAGFSLTDRADQNGSKYLTYTPWNESDKLRFRMGWDGYGKQSIWVEELNQWVDLMSQPDKSTGCRLYNKCGKFGLCSELDGSCDCTPGFERKNWWYLSDGCSRKTPLKCQRNSTTDEDGDDGFVAVKCTKVPDFADSVVETGPQVTCEQSCLNNCSCNAYADVSGLGCMIWTTELVDVQQLPNGGNTLYIRVAHADLDRKKIKIGSADGKKIKIGSATASAAIGLVLMALCIVWYRRRRISALHAAGNETEDGNELLNILQSDRATDAKMGRNGLTMLSYASVMAATENLSIENKLGQGGFGPVYKGKMVTGQEIAVKRLSNCSGQGTLEFKNELILISELQHTNLVQLFGFCIHGEERMLIYDYMPNKSLDYLLFDSTRAMLLDWKKRFSIVEGIAQGLLYLHKYSRVRVIHRDLKASNILLDADMNPKISDFGLARIFTQNELQVNTKRVVGTYGYMSPEYAMEGIFSIKSDVYSFGVLMLEIISGRRNNSFYTADRVLNIVGHAWELWKEGAGLRLMDPAIIDSCINGDQLLRCIHIGLLCVEENAADRPAMSDVISMLTNGSLVLPIPTKPAFFTSRKEVEGCKNGKESKIISANGLSISTIDAR